MADRCSGAVAGPQMDDYEMVLPLRKIANQLGPRAKNCKRACYVDLNLHIVAQRGDPLSA